MAGVNFSLSRGNARGSEVFVYTMENDYYSIIRFGINKIGFKSKVDVLSQDDWVYNSHNSPTSSLW